MFYSIEEAAEYCHVDPEQLLIGTAKGALNIYNSFDYVDLEAEMPEEDPPANGVPDYVLWPKEKSIKFARDALMADKTGLNHELRELSSMELALLYDDLQDVRFSRKQLDVLLSGEEAGASSGEIDWLGKAREARHAPGRKLRDEVIEQYYSHLSSYHSKNHAAQVLSKKFPARTYRTIRNWLEGLQDPQRSKNLNKQS